MNNKYEGKNIENISFPLGGIGTGSIGFAGNGRLLDWEIFNGPNKGSGNGFTHFAVKTEKNGKVIDARVLNGDKTDEFTGRYGVSFGHGIANNTMAGFPHFRKCVFYGEYPLARLELEDDDFPGKAEMSAFNPMIPLNSDDSSLPCAMFEIKITNTTKEDLDYTLSGVLTNPRGSSVNEAKTENNMSGILLGHTDYGPMNPAIADMTIATPDTENVFQQEYWFRGMWYDHIETYWRELTTPGFPEVRKYDTPGGNDTATLLVKKHAKAGETVVFKYVLTWSAPYFVAWWDSQKVKDDEGNEKDVVLQNYYSFRFANSFETAKYVIGKWDTLYSETLKFHDALFSTTLPPEVVDAASATMSVLKTATVLRVGKKGDFWGWEGLSEHGGSCQGTCSHVWTYVYATSFLFPDIERNIRELDYKYSKQPNAEMSFRVKLPFGREPGTNRACVDGQMGGIIKTYREWKLSGDDEWLKSIWKDVKETLEFAWREDNQDKWDLDCDGVLEGRQHHTLDMELFGTSSWLEGMYLAALKAGSIMARYLGETEDADKYEKLFENGKAWSKDNLFNGEYFIQNLNLNDEALLHKYTDGTLDIFGNDAFKSYWNDETKEIKYQIGEGCEIDQLLGQWHADILGLGDLFDPEQIQIALKNMYKYNFKCMRDNANPYRIFCLNDEKGAIMCSFPEGHRKPTIPILTSRETMHGFEYSFAGLLISRGYIEEGLSVVKGVRDRYNGAKRNPWNEIECGSNYSRSMSSFALIPILSGMTFDAVKGHLGFNPLINQNSFKSFWSSGTAYGSIDLSHGKAVLDIVSGSLKLNTFSCPGAKNASKVTIDGNNVDFEIVNGEILLKSTTYVNNSLVIE